MGGSGRMVVILGGGVAGMSAAHELVRRGYQVQVLEAHEIAGGKARSIAVTAQGLPGEHGFRFFPSFYRHLTATLKGIPYADQPDGVLGNLVDTTRTAAARFPCTPGEPPVTAGERSCDVLVRDDRGRGSEHSPARLPRGPPKA